MDPRYVIAMVLERVLETERHNVRLMEELRASHDAVLEKEKERSKLMRKKKKLLAKKAAEAKLFGDFMAFIGAIDKNDLENAQKFDEKAMLKAVTAMMNSDGGENGGVTGDHGDLVEDGIAAPENSVGRCGGDNGGFAGDRGEIADASKNDEEARMSGSEETKGAAGGESRSSGVVVTEAVTTDY
ncbi:hypothetical protein PTKIN_Ptkin01aG0368700 [Pterospermum kingtungense]